MKFSSGEKMHTAGVTGVKIYFFEFCLSNLFLIKKFTKLMSLTVGGISG